MGTNSSLTRRWRPSLVTRPEPFTADGQRFLTDAGWMIAATILCGTLNAVQQMVVQRSLLAQGEYGLYTTLRETMAQLAIPLGGVQFTFVRLATRAGSSQMETLACLRTWLVSVLIFGAGLLLLCWCFADPVRSYFHLKSLTPLILTLLATIASLLLPAYMGILQASQRFSLLAWGRISVDASLLLGVVWGVTQVRPDALGGISGLLLGLLTALAVVVRMSGASGASLQSKVSLAALLRHGFPLTLGIGIPAFMLSEDIFVVRRHFADQIDGYAAARVAGRTLVFMTAPLIWVIFPKIVKQASKGGDRIENWSCLGIVGVGVLVAMGCSLYPEVLLRLLSGQRYLHYSQWVAWFAWAMLPLALSTVLINGLLARGCFEGLPVLLLLVGTYGVALRISNCTPATVICLMGITNLMLLGASWMYFHKARVGPPPP